MTSKEEFPIRPILEHFGFELTDRPGKVHCKFHQDRVASATWSQYYYKCFGCDAHGDAVRLLVEQEGLEWADAYNRAKDLSGELHQAVPGKPQRGGAVPSGSRHHRRNRPFVPPRSSR